MAEVLLLHHAQGSTTGLASFAEVLRGAGHVVHAPDLYDGHTFTDLVDGLTHAERVGFGSLASRGVAAAEQLPESLVYIGFSLGVMSAQQLAQTRPGARGALLVGSCVGPREFAPGWPAGVPVQVHGAERDEIFVEEGDLEAARQLVDSAPDDAELFLYDCEGHLFCDSSLADHDAVSATLFTERALEFLEHLG